jgi:hypothetical protein
MSNVEAMVVLVNGGVISSQVYTLIVDLSDLSERLWFHSRESHLHKHLSVSTVVDQIRDLIECMEGLKLNTETVVEVLYQEQRLEVVGRKMDFNWCGDELELDDGWGKDSIETLLETEFLPPRQAETDKSADSTLFDFDQEWSDLCYSRALMYQAPDESDMVTRTS